MLYETKIKREKEAGARALTALKKCSLLTFAHQYGVNISTLYKAVNVTDPSYSRHRLGPDRCMVLARWLRQRAAELNTVAGALDMAATEAPKIGPKFGA